jgi:hypothetical protein
LDSVVVRLVELVAVAFPSSTLVIEAASKRIKITANEVMRSATPPATVDDPSDVSCSSVDFIRLLLCGVPLG